MSKRERWILVALVLAAAVLRVALNDVAAYSRADEQHYVEYTRTLVEQGFFHGYRVIVDRHVSYRELWVFPPPIRWGWFTLTWLVSELRGSCDPRGIAWISTLAGIAAVPLTFAAGRRFVGTRAALIAAALTVGSPLQLAMSRRALTDELFCAAGLALLWALSARRRGLAVAALTFLFAIKETAFLLAPALLALVWMERRAAGERIGWADLAPLVLSPLVYAAVGVGLSGGVAEFVAVLRTPFATVGAEYPARMQAGPPHRLLLDLFTLSPLVFLAATGALARLLDTEDAGARRLGVVTVALVTVFCLSPSKNVRYVILADPLLRLLSGWLLVTRVPRSAVLVALLVVGAAVEFALFQRIFVVGGVYDPVSDNLLRALRIIP